MSSPSDYIDDEKCSDRMKNRSMTAAKGTIENEVEREISTRFSFLRVATPFNSLRDFSTSTFMCFVRVGELKETRSQFILF